jgi:hypothetical protein
MGTIAYCSALRKCGTFDVHYWSGGRHCDAFLAEECVDGQSRSGERTASAGIEKRIHMGEDCLRKPALDLILVDFSGKCGYYLGVIHRLRAAECRNFLKFPDTNS